VSDLYRVFPYLASAPEDQPGGALYVPPQGGGRLDNPHVYSVFYLSDAPAGAVAEAFGRFSEWNVHILAGSPSLPGSVRAIARFRLEDDVRVCDLDDPTRLSALDLRPSQVVSRDYVRTRSWAKAIFDRREWFGIRWWSYYDPQWTSFGLWDIERLKLIDIQSLRLTGPAVEEASRMIVRQIVGR
jgi:RES domain